ncbi:MAG: sigma-70 family RNA polymerase sigma factor [Candidatus Eisenbacteria bacterium]
MPEREITALLLATAQGDPLPRSAADRIFSVAYEELRRLAQREMRRERSGHTLQPTALLNEAYLRLVDHSQIRWQNRAHFFGIASHAMRQVLIDHARRRGTAKRGGAWQRVSLTGSPIPVRDGEIDAIDMERALERLASLHPRMARVVELRVFSGMTGKEIAFLLGVSRKTVVDDWRVASMWLRAELAGLESGEETDAPGAGSV